MIAAALLASVGVAGPAGPLRWMWLGSAAAVAHPLVGAGAVAVAVGARLTRRREPPSGGLLMLCDQVALALRAGLTLEGALRSAAGELGPGLRGELGAVLRSAHRHGLGRALEVQIGAGRRLYRVGARAVRTGAPLVAAVESLADEVRHEEHARRLAAAKRLPVRLLLPLALLILPGFVLLTVGPALAGSLARLQIGW
jgi:Flp pilus assembly protein TadB